MSLGAKHQRAFINERQALKRLEISHRCGFAACYLAILAEARGICASSLVLKQISFVRY